MSYRGLIVDSILESIKFKYTLLGNKEVIDGTIGQVLQLHVVDELALLR
jgi:hypothetical protein